MSYLRSLVLIWLFVIAGNMSISGFEFLLTLPSYSEPSIGSITLSALMFLPVLIPFCWVLYCLENPIKR